jgi:DNA polymerase (family 10)
MEVYAQVRLPYIEPELREDTGEIQAAQQGRLPKLVTLHQIRGDPHCHTTESDGRNTLSEMVEAAKARGYEHLAMPNEILKELDLTVCSMHYKLNLPPSNKPRAFFRAMDNPFFRILGHPTGRLINQRPPLEIDIERILRTAAERACFLEVNAQPDRLDLSHVHCKLAKELGVKRAISTDAHRTSDRDFMRFGVDQARRGWIEQADVLNSRSLADLKRSLTRK